MKLENEESEIRIRIRKEAYTYLIKLLIAEL